FIYGVRAITGIIDERIVAAATVEYVVAGAADEGIVAAAAVHDVVAGPRDKSVVEARAVKDDIACPADNRHPAGQADAGAIAVDQRLDLGAEILIVELNLIAGDAVADQQIETRHVEGHVGGRKPRSQHQLVIAAGLVDRVRAVPGIVDEGVIASAGVQ